MRARWWHQRRQLGDEVHRIPFDTGGAIAVGGGCKLLTYGG